MLTKHRPRSRAPLVFALLALVLAAQDQPASSSGRQAAPAPALDHALRANDLDGARRLVPDDWAAAEQLFVSYLERAFPASSPLEADPAARVLAGRLADIFFRLVEYDFAPAVVHFLDTADPPRREALIGTVRDYHATLERVRTLLKPLEAQPGVSASELSQRRQARGRENANALVAVADRFRDLGCPRCELHALRSLLNVGTVPQPRADQLAAQLGDDLSIVRTLPFTETSLRKAERLGSLRLQCSILESLASSSAPSSDPAKLDQAVRFLERARALWRTMPPKEAASYWQAPSAAPRPAVVTLPSLWVLYVRTKRSGDDRQALVDEALQLAKPFGNTAVRMTLNAFATRAVSLGPDAADAIVAASRALGPQAELETTRVASGTRAAFRRDAAERALALAVATADAHERAATLEWFARTSLEAGKCEPFPPIYGELLELCAKSDEASLVAEALASDGGCRLARGDQVSALDSYKKAIQLADRAGLPARAAEIASRGADRARGNNFSPAVRHELATLAIENAASAGSAYELAKGFRIRSQIGTGASHQSLEDIKSAVTAAERFTEESGSAQEELSCLRLLADEHVIRREYQAAVDVQRRRAELSHRLEPAWLYGHEIDAYQELTAIYSENLGEPALAYETAERVRALLDVAVISTAAPADLDTLAGAYFALGHTAAMLGQSVAALEYWDTALAKAADAPAAQQHSASTPVQRRRILTARAQLYEKLGDFEAALKDRAAVEPLIPRTLQNFKTPESLQRAEVKARIAWTEMQAGSPDRALASVREAIALAQQDTSGQWPGTPLVEHAVDILLATGNVQDAIAFQTAVLEGVRRTPVEQPTAERWCLEHLARAYARDGQQDRARALLVAAIEIDRTHPTAEAGGLAGSLLALGQLEIEAGNLARARQCLEEARSAVNPYDLDRIWRIERALAAAARREGDGAGAERHYAAAIAAFESIRERRRPEEFRLTNGFDQLTLYEEQAAQLAARAIRSGRPDDADRAFQAAEHKRTRMLWDLLSTGWSRIPPAAIPDQLRRLFEAESRVGAKRALLREQYEQPPETRDGALVERLEREVRQLQDEHARLLVSVAQGEYRYAAPAALASSLAARVRATLGPSRALIEYLVTEDRSYAFVASASGVKVVPLDAGRREVRRLVAALLKPFRQLRSGRVDLTRLPYDTRAAYALYKAIFAPLRSVIGAGIDLVIVPDDVLTFVPFDALIEEAPRPASGGAVLHAELAGERYLLHRHAISYMSSSAQLVAPATGAARQSAAPGRFFAMANPAAIRAAAPAPGAEDPLTRQLRSGAFGAFLSPLPGAETEVQRIARYFPAGATVVLTGADATETAYEGQAGQFGVLHFATHAVASDGQPFYSTLVLAPDDAPGRDGFLQAYEVIRTPLRADLVVLSGCETALGAEDLGQGLVGLVAAFQQAGARSVLATLWSIDEATVEVMDRFYGAMAKGASPASALRGAKLAMLKQKLRIGNAEVSLAHPFFWAPFVLVSGQARETLPATPVEQKRGSVDGK